MARSQDHVRIIVQGPSLEELKEAAFGRSVIAFTCTDQHGKIRFTVPGMISSMQFHPLNHEGILDLEILFASGMAGDPHLQELKVRYNYKETPVSGEITRKTDKKKRARKAA